MLDNKTGSANQRLSELLGKPACKVAEIFTAIKKIEVNCGLYDLIFIAQELGILPEYYSFKLSNGIIYSPDLESDLIQLKRYSILFEMTYSGIFITKNGIKFVEAIDKSIQEKELKIIKKLGERSIDRLNDLAKILMVSKVNKLPIESDQMKESAYKLFRITEAGYKQALGVYDELVKMKSE